MKSVEVGVVTAHPIKQMWLQVKTILITWKQCRKLGVPCNKWYGVYPVGSEKILAQVGSMPDAESRANVIAKALNE
jgi:hypothetical protein